MELVVDTYCQIILLIAYKHIIDIYGSLAQFYITLYNYLLRGIGTEDQTCFCMPQGAKMTPPHTNKECSLFKPPTPKTQ
jgi:hypothetical protein